MDAGTRIAVDAASNAYITGVTYSADFPATYSTGRTPDRGDAFITAFNSGGNLTFSMLLGGSGSDDASTLVLGPAGTVWAGGITSSSDLPVTAGAVQSRYGGAGGHTGRTLGIGDGWVARINPSPSAATPIVALTYLGGSLDDQVLALVADTSGNVYAGGHTLSTDFPITAAYQSKYAGGSDLGDGFIAKLNSSLTNMIFSTYFGGALDDTVAALAVDSNGNPWILGSGLSTNLTPASLGSNPSALQQGYQGALDLFLVKLDPAAILHLFGQQLE